MGNMTYIKEVFKDKPKKDYLVITLDRGYDDNDTYVVKKIVHFNNGLTGRLDAYLICSTLRNLDQTFEINSVEINNYFEDFTYISKKQINAINKSFKSKRPKNKQNHVGVELEFLSTLNKQGLAMLIAKHNLQDKVTVKEDGSVEPDDNQEYDGYRNGLEVAIMDTEKNIIKTVQKVMRLLREESVTNDTCGVHVHLDARHRNKSVLYKNLYEAQNLLYSMCDYSRYDNTYCMPTRDYSPFNTNRAVTSGRYVGINTQSYSKFKTIEVRILNGTLDGDVITNYISLLMKIANKKSSNTRNANIISKWSDLKANFDLRGKLEKYVKNRVKYYNEKNIHYLYGEYHSNPEMGKLINL